MGGTFSLSIHKGEKSDNFKFDIIANCVTIKRVRDVPSCENVNGTATLPSFGKVAVQFSDGYLLINDKQDSQDSHCQDNQ